MKKRVALITHELSLVGGLPTMTRFLHGVLTRSGCYEPELISLATSAADGSSLRLRSPATWFSYPRIENVGWHELAFTHAGVSGSELEFQRYRPRRQLSRLLRSYDLLQFVVGSPPWACVAQHVNRPIAIWTATTTRADRESQLRGSSPARRAWASLMVPIAERYERRALKTADVVFALSEYTRAAVEPIAGEGKVVLAPCGVDTDRFRPTSVPLSNYILCVARLSDPRKNVELLLKAYALLKKKLGEVPYLYLIGDPPSEESAAQLAVLGIKDEVRLLGPKQGDELADLYRNAKFFVLSSNEEGLGIVILEAMSSGLPVVSTACGGPTTAVREGETGFLTPTGDETALAQAMETLVRDEGLRERMGREGRRVIESRFSLAAAGNVFLNKYEELLWSNNRVTSKEELSLAV